MLELLGFGVTALVALLVIGLALSVVFVVAWAVTLPFRLLGLAFQVIVAVLALPFLLAIAIAGTALFGVGLLVFLLPALPFVLVGWLVFALLRRDRRPSRAA